MQKEEEEEACDDRSPGRPMVDSAMATGEQYQRGEPNETKEESLSTFRVGRRSQLRPASSLVVVKGFHSVPLDVQRL